MEEERKGTSLESQACVGSFNSDKGFGFDLEFNSKPQKEVKGCLLGWTGSWTMTLWGGKKSEKKEQKKIQHL